MKIENLLFFYVIANKKTKKFATKSNENATRAKLYICKLAILTWIQTTTKQYGFFCCIALWIVSFRPHLKFELPKKNLFQSTLMTPLTM